MDVPERWLVAARTLVQSVGRSVPEGLARLFEPDAVQAVDNLNELLERLDGDDARAFQARHLLAWLHWYRFQALPAGQDEQEIRDALEMFALVFLNADDPMAAVPGPLLPAVADRAVPLAVDVLAQALNSADAGLRDAAVLLWQRIAQATPADHADRAARASNLGSALLTRFERSGNPADLDAAVEAGREAVATIPVGHPQRAEMQSNLGITLRTRFERSGDPADLDAAVDAGRQAVAAVPADHPERPTMLSNLGIALRARFSRGGAPADLDAAIDTGREAVNTTPADSPRRAGHLSNLAIALESRFEWAGDLTDLDEAVAAGREAVDLTPAGHPDHAMYLSNLGIALLSRFERHGSTADLDAAIDAEVRALDATPAEHPGRAAMSASLGIALLARFGETGSMSDLSEAADFARRAADATAPDDPARAERLADVGVAAGTRFARTGSMADLDEAIDYARQALAASAHDNPGRPGLFTGFGTALRLRYNRTGAVADLDDAIEAMRRSVITPGDHVGRSRRLSNLGTALLERYDRTGSNEDIDAAVETGRQAVAAIAIDHPLRAGHLSNLGSTLRTRFVRTGKAADLDESIEVGREAVAATRPGHPDRAMYLSNLGGALGTRFARTGSAADLDEAIETGREAVQSSPADLTERATFLVNLGLAQHARFEQTGADDDSKEAIAQFTQAAEMQSAAPSTRVHACRAGARLCGTSDPERGAGLLELAVGLLPRLAGRHLQRGDQQYALGGLAGLAADAVALALADDSLPEPQRAVRALRLSEAARGVLLSQALDTRSDLTDLRARHPDLAEQYIALRDLLDRPPAATKPFDARALAPQSDPNALAADFETLLERIRALPEFTAFARLPDIEDLLARASDGPVVTFNVSTHRSDALLLTTSGITVVSLPRLDYDTAVTYINDFHRALAATADADASMAELGAAQASLRSVLAWLWDAAIEPALDALGFTGPVSRETPPDAWPRVWWAPGGLLGLLPVHAAGHHDSSGRSVLDRVVSSYTPTVRALQHARQQSAASRAADAAAEPGTSLIVAMPTTPDLPAPAPLPATAEEAKRLAARLPNAVVLIEPGDAPTRAAVLEQLPRCAIAHFACHGTHDPADPSASRLLLHDHATAPLTVASLAPVRLDRAQLAYLSACRTAFHGTQLLDEAIHLGTAFQLAGFPHVIATLWEIPDHSAVTIADAFYTRLAHGHGPTGNGAFDTSRAAQALHHTIRDLRHRRPNLPSLWAAYLHTGA